MSLIHLWELEETGVPYIDIISGVNLTTATGTPGSVPGKVGNALDAGSSFTKVINNVDSVGISGADEATTMCWVYPLAVPPGFGIAINPGDGIVPLIALLITSGNVFSASIKAPGETTFLVTSTTGYSINNWYHIAATYKRNDVAGIYINGGSIEGSTATVDKPLDTALRMGIGAATQSGNFPIDSYIDQVAIFDEALSEARINSIYNNGNGIPLGKGYLFQTVYRRRRRR